MKEEEKERLERLGISRRLGTIVEIGFLQQQVFHAFVLTVLLLVLAPLLHSPYFLALEVVGTVSWYRAARKMDLYRGNYLNSGALSSETQNLYIAFWADYKLPASLFFVGVFEFLILLREGG